VLKSWVTTGVEIHEIELVDARMPQHQSRRQSIAAAEDQHALGLACGGHRGDYECLVIAILVDAGELQMTVEIESQVPPPASEHEALQRRVLREDHVVLIHAVFEAAYERGAVDEARAKQREGAEDPGE
jgi:hypothetical protein